jgi:hypothetical protein
MKRILGVIFLCATLTACKQQPELADLVEDMVVVTYYDDETQYGQYQSYYVALDTVGFVSNFPGADTLLLASQYDFAEQIPAKVNIEMLNLGFERKEPRDSADLIVNVIVLDNLNVTLSAYPAFLGGFYGYHGFYSYYYAYNYQNYGTLVLQILDRKNAVNNQYKVIWTAYIGDLYTTLDQIGESEQAITQAFVQSPYLKP